MRMRKEATGVNHLLLAGQGDPEADPTGSLVSCAVFTVPPEPIPQDELQAWAGVPPEPCGRYTCFKWHEEGGKHVPIPGTVEQMKGSREDPGAFLVMTKTDDKNSVIILIRAAPPAVPEEAATTSRSFDLMQQLCFATHGDAQAALDIADRTGWQSMPEKLLARFGRDRFGQPLGRVLSDGPEHYSLIVTKGGQVGSEPYKARACAVMASPAERPALARLAAMAAVPSRKCGAEGGCYGWREGPEGVHEPVSEAALDKALATGDSTVTFVMTDNDERETMIVLLVPFR